jgi:hypothetical protein
MVHSEPARRLDLAQRLNRRDADLPLRFDESGFLEVGFNKSIQTASCGKSSWAAGRTKPVDSRRISSTTMFRSNASWSTT